MIKFPSLAVPSHGDENSIEMMHVFYLLTIVVHVLIYDIVRFAEIIEITLEYQYEIMQISYPKTLELKCCHFWIKVVIGWFRIFLNDHL